VFHYNTAGVVHYNIAAPQTLTPGKRTLVFDFKYDGGGVGKGAQGRIERTIPIRFSLDEGLYVGEDTGTPVTTSFDVPFQVHRENRESNDRSETPRSGYRGGG